MALSRRFISLTLDKAIPELRKHLADMEAQQLWNAKRNEALDQAIIESGCTTICMKASYTEFNIINAEFRWSAEIIHESPESLLRVEIQLDHRFEAVRDKPRLTRLLQAIHEAAHGA